MAKTTKEAEQYPIDALLRATLDKLWEAVRSIEILEGANANHEATLRGLSRLATGIASLAERVQARQRLQAKQQSTYRPELVTEWLLKQEAETRLKILRDLSESLDGERSVLS